MIFLIGKSDAQLPAGDRVGTLVVPENGAIPGTRPWAADNGAFSGFQPRSFLRMLERIAVYPGCLWVAVPDVVGDSRATRRRWRQWAKAVESYSLPTAFVAQDGCSKVPAEADAVFIGGSTEWKLSDHARRLCEDERWVHMGRVNTQRRARLARAWGCDSVDGSNFARYTNVKLPGALAASQHQQLILEMTA